MSRLRELVRRTARPRPQAIGFGREAEPSQPPIVVVALVDGEAEAQAAVGAGAGALLYAGPTDGAARVVSAAGARPVGCVLAGATGDDADALVEAGIDFLVFDDRLTEAAAVASPHLGRVPHLGEEVDEASVRAIAMLEPDAALIEPPHVTTEGGRLSARALATMRRRSALLRAPLAIDARDDGSAIEPGTLAAWRDSGAPILIVASGRTEEAVLAVASVPPPPERERERADALLPGLPGWSGGEDDDD